MVAHKLKGTSDKHYVKSVLKLVIIYIQQGSHQHDTQYLQAMRLSGNEIKIKQLRTNIRINVFIIQHHNPLRITGS